MRIEPLPADRIESQVAGIAAVFASAFAKEGQRPKPEDFMVTRIDVPEPKPQSPQQMRTQLDLLKAAMPKRTE